EVTTPDSIARVRAPHLEIAMTEGLTVTAHSADIPDGISATLQPAEAAPERWFDLQGRPVASPTRPGIYILRRGSTAVKRIIR
ncbi:MAG: hypothetical protein K2G59_06065, partial [Muribaculaceae bacterium]|nr:hypothetical protein [Muribaculaceae bacterium]